MNMKTKHFFANLAFAAICVFGFSNCNEGRSIYIEGVTYIPKEFDVPKDGGIFTVDILDRTDCKFGWADADSVSNIFLPNATCDTIEATWFKAVMKGDSCNVIEISIQPNDTQNERVGDINMWRGEKVGGDYAGFISFRQSAN